MAIPNINMDSCNFLPNPPLLKLVGIKKFVCPLSKEFFLNPIRFPCGHIFNENAITEWYHNNQTRVCPIITCQKPYEALKGQEDEDPLRKELAQSLKKEMYCPNEMVKAKIFYLYSALQGSAFESSQQKEQIEKAIRCFLSGDVSEGVNQMTQISQISLHSANSRSYSLILNLMKMHMQTVSNQINDLIQKSGGLPPVAQSQTQGFPASMQEARMAQSLSLSAAPAALWNGMGSAGSSNFHPAHLLISQAPPLPGSGNSQIQGPPAPIIGTGTRMPESLLTSSESSGMGLREPIASTPQTSFESGNAALGAKKAQESNGGGMSKEITYDEQVFIGAIKNKRRGGFETICHCMQGIENVDIVMDEEGNTPLLWVIKNNEKTEELLKLVKALLDKKANPNAKNNKGETALHLLANQRLQGKKTKKEEIRKLVCNELIEHGACVDSQDSRGQTPLNLATRVGNNEMKWYFSDKTPNERTTDDRAQLQEINDEEDLQFLGEVNRNSNQGQLLNRFSEHSPGDQPPAKRLHSDTQTERNEAEDFVESVFLFSQPTKETKENQVEVESNENFQVQDNNLENIFASSETGGDERLIAQVPVPGAGSQIQGSSRKISYSEQTFINAIKHENKESKWFFSVSQCMAWIKNVDIVMDEEGNTPLLWVIKNSSRQTHKLVESEKIVNALLAKKANPNAQNNAGQTALHLYASHLFVRRQRGMTKKEEVMRRICDALIKHGADINIKDIHSQTPLGLAKKKKNEMMKQYLLEKTPNKRATDHRGQLKEINDQGDLQFVRHVKGRSNQGQSLKRLAEHSPEDQPQAKQARFESSMSVPTLNEVEGSSPQTKREEKKSIETEDVAESVNTNTDGWFSAEDDYFEAREAGNEEATPPPQVENNENNSNSQVQDSELDKIFSSDKTGWEEEEDGGWLWEEEG